DLYDADASELRTPEVNRAVSTVAAQPEVRTALVQRQREWAEAHGGGVVEGRDIGTVVFPDAAVKVFLTASEAERARRRGGDEDASDIARRDQLDSSRAASPLVAADDAVVIDTTGRSVEDIVEEIVALAGKDRTGER
ncbi:MAG: (d)CMP kinase, partial [Actinomycetota bacterium]|nr:(d)CMP kinase [Actinomycetota bacterium]